MTGTDTMPQGAAVSPERDRLAVVASGYNRPTLRLYATRTLEQTASIPLPGAYGRPLWIDRSHVLIAGANAGVLLDVDVEGQTVTTVPLPAKSYPTQIASHGSVYAAGTDGDYSVRIGALDALHDAKPVKIGGFVGGLAFSADGKTLFASNRSGRSIVAIDTGTLATRTIATYLHPSALLTIGNALYVAESGAGSVGIFDASTGALRRRISVGVSPNALSTDGTRVFVSLGAANSVAVLRDERVVGRVPAGWYPTDAVPLGTKLFVVNGKGEGPTPDPFYNAKNRKSDYDYIGTIEYGSIRVYDLARAVGEGNPQGQTGRTSAENDSVLRLGGPIRHVFFVLKENRSYDQVFGDVPLGNGDPKLAWFGAKVTPNAHALAARFGLFDNTYTSGEVSEAGHDWSDAAFVNDYVERNWPMTYGNRGNDDATLPGLNAMIPPNGYIWQAAKAAGVSFRNYGEQTNVPEVGIPSMEGRNDLRYVSFDLNYSDVDRVKEWRRELTLFLRENRVPQLEYIWLPNDHTAASRPGMLTPVACVAQNDYATGLIVDAVSHSPIWKSSAIFFIEDDSQDGPDHVGDQRTEFVLASPYARGGLQHGHYSTVSVLHTIELMLGIKPLSPYDATAAPLYAAFSEDPNLQPYRALPPQVSITARNGKLAYGARASEGFNLRRPDANPATLMSDILAHNLAQ
jgi:hypothetical protein